MNEIKPVFQSSLDPSKVSLTIQSIAKFLIFVAGTYAIHKGFDPVTATNVITQLSDILISAIPACFAMYHAGEAVWGVVRKFFVISVDNSIVVPTV